MSTRCAIRLRFEVLVEIAGIPQTVDVRIHIESNYSPLAVTSRWIAAVVPIPIPRPRSPVPG